jgi:hypothetical protein
LAYRPTNKTNFACYTLIAETAGKSKRPSDPGITLLRELVGAGRAGRVASSLPLTTEVLLNARGPEAVRELIEQYAADELPALFGSSEGRQFGSWLQDRAVADAALSSALALDRAGLEWARTGEPQQVLVTVDPRALINAISNSGDLVGLPCGHFVATVG